MTPPSTPGFLTTRWTRVCLAKADSDEGRGALAELCDAYYEPVLAFLRCELRDADAARDTAHAFFAHMLGGGTIHSAERDRGRFRAYLLGAVKHFLSHQRAAVVTQKRGGAHAITSLDDEAAQVPDAQQLTPEAAYDRQWALTVLARALDAVRQECAAEGRSAFFDQAKPWLTGESRYGDQTLVVQAGGMSAAAFKMAVHRLKHRFRQQVKAEVAGTLDDAAMVAAEMESLFAALAAG